jgi:predicted lipase
MSIVEFEELLEDTKSELRKYLKDDYNVYKSKAIKLCLISAYKKLTNNFEEQTFIENMKDVWDRFLETEVVGA